MKLLLIYGTTEGQTGKVAKFVAEQFAERRHEVRVLNAVEEAAAGIDPREFDGVIVAGSLHAGRYQAAVVHFVSKNLVAINGRPNAFLSVSLAAAGDDEDDIKGLEQCLAAFTQQTGWTPQRVHHVAGAFRYTAYDFLKRWAMKYIAYRKGGPLDTSRDHELTDWADVARFVSDFLKDAQSSAPTAG
jgi:menaquinone-dependent protoporphyrinogen oxidase